MKQRLTPFSASPLGARARAFAFVAIACSLAGCPGHLENPERFRDGAVGREDVSEPDVPIADTGSGPMDGSAGCAMGATYVETMLLPQRCGMMYCHAATASAAGLDLASSNIAHRLVGVQSATTAQGGSCPGMLLVDPAHPTGGLLLNKVAATPACGSHMPLTGSPLSAAEMMCLQSWVAQVAGGSSGGDAGHTDGGSQ